MTPEQMQKGIELSKKIAELETELKQVKKSTVECKTTFRYRTSKDYSEHVRPFWAKFVPIPDETYMLIYCTNIQVEIDRLKEEYKNL